MEWRVWVFFQVWGLLTPTSGRNAIQAKKKCENKFIEETEIINVYDMTWTA